MLKNELLPILTLLVVIAVVVSRLPKVDVGHSDAFRRRRLLNWLPLGLTYSFLYFARYNLAAVKDIGALTEQEYGTIFGIGAAVYGVSFLLNGPICDRVGGRRTILIAAFGSAMANLLLGLLTYLGLLEHAVGQLAVLYGINMYFQSFGAVAIVKVNSSWFHVRERGTFAGIFGILISLGIYFAFDWSHRIAATTALYWVYLAPAGCLLLLWLVDLPLVRNQPADAGLGAFDPADASSGDDGPRLPAREVFGRMLRSPIIMTIAAIEFCSGFLRQAVMQWYRDFDKALGFKTDFVYVHWGMLLCVAGILGGVVAGIISDRVFKSRRAPVSGVLYGIMLACLLLLVAFMTTPKAVGWIAVVMSMSVIGVHGMLSGTASMDFGGRKNAGVAVGMIDGFVYLGTVAQSFLLGNLLPEKGTAEGAVASNWRIWPMIMIPVAVLGIFLCRRIWHALPAAASAAATRPASGSGRA